MTSMIQEPSGLIHKGIVAIMGDVGPIAKLHQNAQQGYKFRGIDDVYNALHPILVKHGVYCIPEVLGREVQERASKGGGTLFCTRVDVRFTLVCAEDGSSVSGTVVGEAMDTGDKSSNKAMSAAMKYFFFQVFCIPTEGDNDADARTHQPVVAMKPVQQAPVAQPEPPQDAFDAALSVARGAPAAPPPVAAQANEQRVAAGVADIPLTHIKHVQGQQISFVDIPHYRDAVAAASQSVECALKCFVCGKDNWDNRDKDGAVVFKCKENKWDSATKTSSGCVGGMWRNDYLEACAAANAPVSETLSFPQDSIPF